MEHIKYAQELRVFVIGCPSNTPIAEKLMAKINEAADRFENLTKQRDALLVALQWVLGDAEAEIPLYLLSENGRKAKQAIADAESEV